MTDKTAASPQLGKDLELELKMTAAAPWVLNKAHEVFVFNCDEITRKQRYTSHLHYYDTNDLRLRNSGVLLRTLDANAPFFGSRIQIKTAGVAAGEALARSEFNLAARKNGLRLRDIKGHPATDLLTVAKGKSYKHWFTTVTQREELRGIFTVNGKRVMIECALDQVTYHRGDNNYIFRTGCEIELEVKQAYSDPALTAADAQAALAHVAQLMRASLPHLKVTTASRADLGFGDLAGIKGDSRAATPKPKTI